MEQLSVSNHETTSCEIRFHQIIEGNDEYYVFNGCINAKSLFDKRMIEACNGYIYRVDAFIRPNIYKYFEELIIMFMTNLNKYGMHTDYEGCFNIYYGAYPLINAINFNITITNS